MVDRQLKMRKHQTKFLELSTSPKQQRQRRRPPVAAQDGFNLKEQSLPLARLIVRQQKH
jgi:hypothetical protein